MRKFTKKLQESKKGSGRLISDMELAELEEFVSCRGYRIIAIGNRVRLEEGSGEHIINISLTERDAIKIFKTIKPITFSRKSPPEISDQKKGESGDAWC